MSDKPASETPRTDAELFAAGQPEDGEVGAEFARSLERALHAAEQRATQAEQSLAQERAARERAEACVRDAFRVKTALMRWDQWTDAHADAIKEAIAQEGGNG